MPVFDAFLVEPGNETTSTPRPPPRPRSRHAAAVREEVNRDRHTPSTAASFDPTVLTLGVVAFVVEDE